MKDKTKYLYEKLIDLQEKEIQGLMQFKYFHDHVASHKEVKEAPINPGIVMCKVCNKTIDEITLSRD